MAVIGNCILRNCLQLYVKSYGLSENTRTIPNIGCLVFRLYGKLSTLLNFSMFSGRCLNQDVDYLRAVKTYEKKILGVLENGR